MIWRKVEEIISQNVEKNAKRLEVDDVEPAITVCYFMVLDQGSPGLPGQEKRGY